jgi:hypothetical protein
MNPIRRIRRIAGVLAGLACAWFGLAVAAPAAFALPVPPIGGGSSSVTAPTQPPAGVHTVVAGGMAGWQIALIAIGAALVAATTAVLADRARAARREPATAGA